MRAISDTLYFIIHLELVFHLEFRFFLICIFLITNYIIRIIISIKRNINMNFILFSIWYFVITAALKLHELYK